MKLLILTRLYDPHLGGVEKFTLNLVKRFDKKYQVIIITEQFDTKLKTNDKIHRHSIYRIPVDYQNERKKKYLIWRWFKNNEELLNWADIIHIHDVFFWIIPYKLINRSQNIFLTFYGWEGTYPIPLKNKIVRKISEKMADGNICVGDFISKWYGTKPDIVTYGAVNSPKYKASNSNTLLYTGRLEKDTGFGTAVELYRQLKNKMQWRLQVAGDGPDKKLAPREANMLGFVPEPEKYIAKAGWVYTTGYLGIIEAFAYRKLVIASYDNPVKKDYLYMHPMSRNMVIGETSTEIADNLSALSPADTRRMTHECREWAKRQTWEKLARQHEQLWGLG